MIWKDFFNNLQPKPDSERNRLLNIILKLETVPDICWYPGSGCDLTPLLLDVPKNPTGRRLFTVGNNHTEKPIMLWMNDYSGEFQNFPDNTTLGKKIRTSYYRQLWGEHHACVTLGKIKEEYRFKNQRITLFTATVKNRKQGKHLRPESGDEYLVCFSNSESEQLFKTIFRKYCFHICAVMLIKQAGFSGQKYDFEQYEALPEMITKYSEDVGMVDYCVIDERGQSDEKPVAEVLSDYSSVGGAENWGYGSARLYRNQNHGN